MKRYIVAAYILCTILLCACERQQTSPLADDSIDYADTACWYEGNTLTCDKETDIFYIAPTCI